VLPRLVHPGRREPEVVAQVVQQTEAARHQTDLVVVLPVVLRILLRQVLRQRLAVRRTKVVLQTTAVRRSVGRMQEVLRLVRRKLVLDLAGSRQDQVRHQMQAVD